LLQKLFICNSDFQVTKICKNFLSAILTIKIKKDTLQLTTKKQNFLLGVDTIYQIWYSANTRILKYVAFIRPNYFLNKLWHTVEHSELHDGKKV